MDNTAVSKGRAETSGSTGRDGPAQRTFTMKVLGKTLEHLGSQLYKRRDAAVAELVANAWTRVRYVFW